ncbi:hypothetical protein MINTM001_14610 [Mycobacterium paraintracellulare]|nr:hypothetical protein MINTM001_14610 [Mycobacterium paraintracellulare]
MGELFLVIYARRGAAGTQGADIGTIEHQRHRGRIDAQQTYARLTKPIGGTDTPLLTHRGEQLLFDRRHRQCSSRIAWMYRLRLIIVPILGHADQ